ncbi:Unknown protein [Striga hermonthica]|uniref:CCHC-type domain-containing protein n=1 Tax=Striga hermonthica TaxID=68872 RepID=A0A9N7ND60_STRHE|nr:Unknown protein [Striga hermonthica]
MGSGGEDLQKVKRAAAAAHDYENDPRWADYWSNVLIPPHMASRNDVVVDHFKHKFYRRYIDPELIVEPIGTSSTSQPARASTTPSQSSSSSTYNSNTRQRNSGSSTRTSGTSTAPPPSPTSLRWDQQTIQFSVNAWVLVVAVFAIFPLVPTNLSNRAYRLSFFGTACSSLCSLYSLYGKPRAWNLPALQVWFQSVVVTKDFIYSIYCLSFLTSHLCLKFALIPILCRTLEHVAKFLRRNFSRSTLYRKYLEEACVWVVLHTTTLSILSSNAEIGIGFLLIISLFSWQRNIVQTFMYWQILKLMYHAPATAGYHQSTWAKIGRTVNPLIMRYAPFLKTPISALQRGFLRLFKNFIGDDERVYVCSGNDFFSFESNGTIAWKVHLNYTCNPNIAPVHGGSSKIYVVAEERVLKIYPLRIGTSEAPVEVFFGPAQGKEGPDEITGLSASISSSCVLVNVKNRGLFALRLTGQLIWSAGPVLYRHGYRQGCRKNITECYFTSKPVIDQCEASIFILNTVGELYSLSVRGPYFKWIQDLSSYGGTFKVTTGNNGRLYVTIQDKSPLVLALDVFTGNLLWRGSIGPLSSSDYEPLVDATGWVSYGSLDGFLYSFSPKGLLKKFPKSVSLNSVIQVEPILDCSGYGVYFSQTEMEGKMSHEYDYVSALKPKNSKFTLLDPASGSIYRSENNPAGKLLFNLSQSDLKHFAVDERTLLAFFAASSNFCFVAGVKLKSSCSQVKTESISIYTGNQRTIVMFLVIESVVLVILAAVVWYCCIFWKKKKLRGLELGKFLEKRRSLRFQKKAFDKMIKELEQKAAASDERVSNLELFEKLSDLVKEREGVRKKLSTTYSLGRDKERSRSSSLLPLCDKKSRSFSFQGSKKESVTIFHNESTSCEDVESSDFSGDGEFDERVEGKGKGLELVLHSMETQELIKLPASSNSGHASEHEGPNEFGRVAITSGSRNLNSEIKAEINGEAGMLSKDDDVDMSISSGEENLDLNSSVLKDDLETADSVEVAVEMTSVTHVNSENGSLPVQPEISSSTPMKDETLLSKRGVKRPRESVDEQHSSVRVIYSSLPRESKQKLEELLQQWSKWHSQKCSSSDKSMLESGEKTYFPALRVGLDNPSAITFWVDNQKKLKSGKDSEPLDSTSVPLYDRGYSLALTSGDASSRLDSGVKLDTSRCFNCGSYGHALKDCPKPRDTVAVNNARREHRSRRNQNSNSRNFTRTRYYQSSRGGKYDGLMPGVLDAETRRMLGLRELDPPPWLNRMRELGYPPGYLDVDLEDQPSGIKIFGEETNENEDEKLGVGPIEPSKKKAVEFPGINAPIPENADKWLWAQNPMNSSNISEHRSQRRHNNPSPYENLNRNERRWSKDYLDDDGPPGCAPWTSPSLSNHLPRYSDYEYGLSPPLSNHFPRYGDYEYGGLSPRASPPLLDHFPRYSDYECGLSSRASPPLLDHFPRYSDYKCGLSPNVPWSPSYGRSWSDRGMSSPLMHDGPPSHGQYGNFIHNSPW